VITNEIVVDSRRESDDEWWLVEGFQACLVRSWARADGTIAWVRTADDEPGLVCVCVWLVRWPMAVPQLSLSLPRASLFSLSRACFYHGARQGCACCPSILTWRYSVWFPCLLARLAPSSPPIYSLQVPSTGTYLPAVPVTNAQISPVPLTCRAMCHSGLG
jgi:hypothetical protein